MAEKSKFFRVAVEGSTSDGRVISRDWIAQMAANYNPATYGARVNCEHLKGYSPEAPFFAYGDVTAVKAEEVDLELGGVTTKKLALFAQIAPTPELIRINAARQKIYTSIEVNPKFASSDQAYLVGLAVTDNPASLGCEVLAFAAAHPEASPFTARKTSPDNLFTASVETKIEFETKPVIEADPTGIFAKLGALIAPFAARQAAAPVVPPPANDNALRADVDKMIVAMGAIPETLLAMSAKASAETVALAATVTSLTEKLASTDANPNKRAPAAGTTSYAQTDC